MPSPEYPGGWLFRRVTGVSLRAKIIGMVLGAVLLIGLAMTLSMRARLSADLQHGLEERGIAIARYAAVRATDFVLTENTFALYQLLRDTLENNPDMRYVFVLDANSAPLVHSFVQGVPPELMALNHPSGEVGYQLQPLMSDEGRHQRGNLPRPSPHHRLLAGEGFYRPTWVEYGVVIGLFALGALLYTLFIKVFPILDVEDHGDEPAPAKAEKSGGLSGRAVLAWGMMIGGFILQFIAYFFLTAPLGIPVNESFSNPRVEFAPTLFIIGVMTVFIAAVLYEVLPDRKVRA